ncbi:Aminopeptidase N [Anabarilius grahami]|uniref:Aminopeptidase n=1 Tax=Anabarilius grahami TaxID=495550 RepID=A0A3N0YAL5_ANAGA|nr:Aminopeptidase N [Anabarilius grahami]
MAKGTCISKAVAVGIGVITVSSVGGLVLMAVMFQHQISQTRPLEPPKPTDAPGTPTDPPSNIRLFDFLIPENYKVFLQTYLYGAIPNNYTEQSFFFKGNSTVRLKSMKEPGAIYLHVHNLNVTNVEVRKSDSNEKLSVKGYKIHYNESNFLEIQLGGKLSGNGTYYDLFTTFEGELFEDLSGLYASRYTEPSEDEDEEDEESLLQPTDARKVFPCFDEPALKAVFEITIIHRPGTKALSNGIADPHGTQIDGEDWVVTTFSPTPIMSTYLLAFTISDFESRIVPSRPNMHIYARKEAIKAGHADYATEITHTILTHYEDIFELKYREDNLDQIALPDFGVGAMENWGLISYQESGLLYDEDTGSTFDKEWVATLIAHELAHQWFGNLVTMSWWNDLWLNEAFATYMSYTGVEAAGWDLEDLIVLREIQSAFHVDSLNSSRPLSLHENDVQTFSEIIELFDDITYSKGAAVLRMLSAFMPKGAFMKGIRETNQNLEAFMSTWVEQVGYPVITIITQTGDTTQEQFLLKQEAGHDIPWYVQITFIKSNDLVMKHDTLTRKGPVQKPNFQISKDQWLLANINCTGFYRVNYDEENWNKLLMQLERNYNVIPLINRGQLIDDAFNLARAHRLNVTIALSLTKYLVNDTEYIPWESALKNLEHFVLMFDRSEVYGPITKYLRKQVTGLYEYFEEYTNNGTIPDKHTDQIHPNLRRAIYCSAIAAGDEDDWEFVWNEYQRATTAAEKDKLRYALSCTKEIWLLNRYLEYTLDPSKIRKMDMVSTINYIAKNVAGQPLAWDFVRGKWSYITQEYGAGIVSLGSLLDGVTQRFSRDVELQELKQLQREQDKDDQGVAARALEQVIERTEANIQWVKENKDIVKEWFNGEL